jgi:O-antigen ligase
MSRLALFGCCALLVGAWLAVNHYPPWVTSHSELLAALAAMLLAVAAIGGRTGPAASQQIAVPWPSVFFAGVAAIPLLQAAGGLIYFAGDGWIAALYLLCAAWVTLWSARLAGIERERWVDSLAWCLLAGALASAAIQQIQRWDIDTGPLSLYVASMRPGHAPFANLAQPNLLADLLLLGLASLMLLYERRKLGGELALLLAVLLTLCIVMTQSRAVLLAFAVAFLWHLLYRRRLALRTPSFVIGALAAGWASLFLVWPRVLQALYLSVLAQTADRLQAGPRSTIFRQLWDAVWLEPWLGWGWNQVSVAQIAVAADHPRSRLVEHSHNVFLDLALWNGVPLALLIVGLAGWWLWRTARRVDSLQGGFAWLVVLLLLTHSLVEFPLEFLYFLVPFAMALGILVSETGDAPALRLPRAAGAAGLAAFVGVLAWASIDYWRMEEAHRDMRFTVARYGKPMPERPPPLLASQFTQLAAFHRFALTTPRADMSPEELDGLRKVAHRFGYAPSLYRYALAQALNGDIDGSRLTMLQLRQLHGEAPYLEGKAELERLAQSQHPTMQALRLP